MITLWQGTASSISGSSLMRGFFLMLNSSFCRSRRHWDDIDFDCILLFLSLRCFIHWSTLEKCSVFIIHDNIITIKLWTFTDSDTLLQQPNIPDYTENLPPPLLCTLLNCWLYFTASLKILDWKLGRRELCCLNRSVHCSHSLVVSFYRCLLLMLSCCCLRAQPTFILWQWDEAVKSCW